MDLGPLGGLAGDHDGPDMTWNPRQRKTLRAEAVGGDHEAGIPENRRGPLRGVTQKARHRDRLSNEISEFERERFDRTLPLAIAARHAGIADQHPHETAGGIVRNGQDAERAQLLAPIVGRELRCGGRPGEQRT